MKPGLMVTTLSVSTLLLAAAAEAQKKPSGCGQDIPVTLQVFDNPEQVPGGDADYGAYTLRSDGGTYAHGGKLDARIQVSNCSKDFVVLLGQTTRRLWAYLDPNSPGAFTTVSEFNFDRVGSVPVTVSDQEMDTYCSQMSYPASQTVDGNYGGWFGDAHQVDDQPAMGGVDVITGARYVRRAAVFGWSGGNATHRLFMQAPRDSPADQCAVDNRCHASWVRVYHPDANTWILSPEPLNEAGDGWDSSKPSAVHTQFSPRTGQDPLGVVELPFRIVVTTP